MLNKLVHTDQRNMCYVVTTSRAAVNTASAGVTVSSLSHKVSSLHDVLHLLGLLLDETYIFTLLNSNNLWKK